MAQNWTNKDGLFIQFGTDQTTSATAGDYLSFGANRVTEIYIDLTTLTSTAAIQDNVTIFPAPPSGQMFIEQVDVVCETAAASGTSFSVGLMQMDRSTIPSSYSTAFVNAMTQAAMGAAGDKVSLTTGSTGAGGLIGTQPANATGPYYITALSSGTFTAGKVRVRISWRGIGTITQ